MPAVSIRLSIGYRMDGMSIWCHLGDRNLLLNLQHRLLLPDEECPAYEDPLFGIVKSGMIQPGGQGSGHGVILDTFQRRGHPGIP